MSRIDFGAKPLMLPQPVLIVGTYDENGIPNAMNAAWGITTDFQEITISLSEHKTTKNLVATGAFTVSMNQALYFKEFEIQCFCVSIGDSRSMRKIVI